MCKQACCFKQLDVQGKGLHVKVPWAMASCRRDASVHVGVMHCRVGQLLYFWIHQWIQDWWGWAAYQLGISLM
jgi:hypothetical protein